MKRASLSSLRREMEDKFFLERDMELLRALRERAASEERKEALADASGITEDHLLDHLIDLDVSPETVAALGLVPLIAVAWADGSVDASERRAVLAAAEQQGMDREHAGYQLLERWLKKKPDPKLLSAWENYVAALLEALGEEDKAALKADLLGRARAVAAASGGLLGLGNKVSKAEQAVLSELEQTFE
jgi:hypothetical protein